jgi:mRNA interferase MazF
MEKLSFGEIVLLRFPYTDGKTVKKRPALIINDFNDGDIIVSRITSRICNTKNDIYIEHWDKVGLKLPSVIRVHKLATLEKSMVEIVMGEIDDTLKNQVKILFSRLTDK